MGLEATLWVGLIPYQFPLHAGLSARNSDLALVPAGPAHDVDLLVCPFDVSRGVTDQPVVVDQVGPHTDKIRHDASLDGTNSANVPITAASVHPCGIVTRGAAERCDGVKLVRIDCDAEVSSFALLKRTVVVRAIVDGPNWVDHAAYGGYGLLTMVPSDARAAGTLLVPPLSGLRRFGQF